MADMRYDNTRHLHVANDRRPLRVKILLKKCLA